MTTRVHSNWSLRAQGMALVILVFVVGALVGGASERIRASQISPQRPAFMRGESLPKEFERLGLSEEQQTAIKKIFEAARPTTDSVMRQLMPSLRAMRDSVHAEVRRVLTEEQAAELDRMMEQRPSRPDTPGGRRSQTGSRRFLDDAPPR